MVRFSRQSRDFDFIVGSGSSVEIANYDADGKRGDPCVFDIELGFVTEIWKNRISTHSGSNGATLRQRVGYDFNFALVLAFPERLNLVNVLGITPGVLASRFPHPLMGSSRSVFIQFNIGDKERAWAEGLPAISYRAAKVLLSQIRTRFDNTQGEQGDGAIGLNIAGEGNSLLWTFEQFGVGLNPVPLHPGIWY